MSPTGTYQLHFILIENIVLISFEKQNYILIDSFRVIFSLNLIWQLILKNSVVLI